MTRNVKGITYEGYIYPHRLPPLEPLSKGKQEPDEQFFIRTHQAFEIWFAQILDELVFARKALSNNPVPEDRVPIITRHVLRAAKVLKLVRQHLPLLESLLTIDFYDFRQELFGASGFQSYRYREIEWLTGFLDDDLFSYVNGRPGGGGSGEAKSLASYREMFAGSAGGPPDQFWSGAEAREAIGARWSEVVERSTLRRYVLDWLGRTPFPVRNAKPARSGGQEFADRFRRAHATATKRDVARLCEIGKLSEDEGAALLQGGRDRLESFLEAPDRRAILFVLQFARLPLLTWASEMLEAFLEFDEALSNFRYRHSAMVSRVLGGGRVSTGGQADAGLPYLRSTFEKKAFPELWDARAYLLGNRESESIYPEEDWWKFYRFAVALEP